MNGESSTFPFRQLAVTFIESLKDRFNLGLSHIHPPSLKLTATNGPELSMTLINIKGCIEVHLIWYACSHCNRREKLVIQRDHQNEKCWLCYAIVAM